MLFYFFEKHENMKTNFLENKLVLSHETFELKAQDVFQPLSEHLWEDGITNAINHLN